MKMNLKIRRLPYRTHEKPRGKHTIYENNSAKIGKSFPEEKRSNHTLFKTCQLQQEAHLKWGYHILRTL